MKSVDKTGVVLLNLGAPDSPAAVKPFLSNLFSDPDILDLPLGRIFRPLLARYIVSKRLPEAVEIYRAIGGSSPLVKWTLRQAEMLEIALSRHGSYRVFAAMRYWKPYIGDTVDNLIKAKIFRVLLLPLYPQYSYTTTGSSLNEWKRVVADKDVNGLEWRMVNNYRKDSGFIDAIVSNIGKGLQKFREKGGEEVTILFSCHSVPLKAIERGDPYRKHVNDTVESVKTRLGNNYSYEISFQSKVGGAKWLQPSTECTIGELGRSGVKNLLVAPISFVSDNSETLYELDIYNRRVAEEVGIEQYEVMPALNGSPIFIEALSNIVTRKTESWN